MKILNFLFLLIFSHMYTFPQTNWFDSFNCSKKRKALKAYKDQDYAQALQILDKLMNEDPYNSEYNYNVGNVFYKQKKYQDAQSAFLRAAEQAIVLSKLQEQAFFNAGNSAYQLEKWLQAVEAYQQVLKINEKNHQANHNLQLALYKLQEQKMQNEEKKENKDENQMTSDNNSSEDKDCNAQNSENLDHSQNNSGKETSESGKQKSDRNSDNQDNRFDQDNQKSNQKSNEKKEKSQEHDGTNQDKKYAHEEGSQQEDLERSEKSGQQKNKEAENQDFQDKSCQKESDLDGLDAEKLVGNENKTLAQNDIKDDINKSEQAATGQIDDEKNDTQDQQGKESLSAYKKPELKNTFKDEYESKASDDDRLTEYYASVMKTLEDLEEKIQKHVIKNKVAMQGAGQHGKKGW